MKRCRRLTLGDSSPMSQVPIATPRMPTPSRRISSITVCDRLTRTWPSLFLPTTPAWASRRTVLPEVRMILRHPQCRAPLFLGPRSWLGGPTPTRRFLALRYLHLGLAISDLRSPEGCRTFTPFPLLEFLCYAKSSSVPYWSQEGDSNGLLHRRLRDCCGGLFGGSHTRGDSYLSVRLCPRM